MRQIQRASGLSTITVLTFALGVGINAAIFMLTYALVLENLLVPHPAVAALMVVALTACYIPARRASRVIPMIGLR